MTTTIVLATRNSKKLAEMERILRGAGLDVHVVSADEVAPDMEDVVEVESTFVGNALLKARATAAHTGHISISDDSGLCIDALNGMPGVLSARWAGSAKDDTANLKLVLEQLADVPEPRRGAHFECAMAVVTPEGDEVTVEGRMDGRIITAPRGQHGFGYDPIFVPNGWQLTTAEMDPHIKDGLSHRGAAIRNVIPVLENLLTGAGEGT